MRLVKLGALVITGLLILLPQAASAQDSLHTTPILQQTDTSLTSADTTFPVWIRPGRTKLERIGYVVGASLLFSLMDYVGTNMVVFAPNNPSLKIPFVYRIVQSAVQTGLSYFLYRQCGLSSTISFNLIWWTWSDDFMWYGWAYVLNPGRPWYNRSNNGLQTNNVTWASWTPVGLLRKPFSIISRDVLVTQSLIGFSIAVTLD